MDKDKDKLSQIKQLASETPVSPAITLTVSHHLNPGALRSAEVSKINSFVICYFYLMMGIGIGTEKKGRMDHIVFTACCYVNK